MFEIYEAEAPEMTERQEYEDAVATIIECADSAPPLDWTHIEQIRLDALDVCYCDDDNLCGSCRDAFAAMRAERLAA